MLQIAIWQKRSLSVSVDLDLFALQIGVEIARPCHTAATFPLYRHCLGIWNQGVSMFQIVCCALDDANEVVARHLGEMTQSDPLGSLPAFAPERLATTARIFLDLVVVPFLLRALFEVNPKTLHAEIGPHVARSVAFFLAACRHGGVS